MGNSDPPCDRSLAGSRGSIIQRPSRTDQTAFSNKKKLEKQAAFSIQSRRVYEKHHLYTVRHRGSTSVRRPGVWPSTTSTTNANCYINGQEFDCTARTTTTTPPDLQASFRESYENGQRLSAFSREPAASQVRFRRHAHPFHATPEKTRFPPTRTSRLAQIITTSASKQA